MEGFNEQVVKRVNKAKQLVIKIIAVIVLIMIPFVGAGLAVLTHIQYIFMVSNICKSCCNRVKTSVTLTCYVKFLAVVFA